MTDKTKWNFDCVRVRQMRKKCLLTQKQLAMRLGLTQSVICEYETGKSTPSLKTLPQLAISLNTSVDYLLGLTDNPHPTIFSAAVAEAEQDLLRAFYSLPPEKRERAVGILIGLGEG